MCAIAHFISEILPRISARGVVPACWAPSRIPGEDVAIASRCMHYLSSILFGSNNSLFIATSAKKIAKSGSALTPWRGKAEGSVNNKPTQ